MSLNRWDDPGCPPPRVGDAVFDTKTCWYHAMIFSDVNNVSVQGVEKINVIHMKPPLESGPREILTPENTHWLGALSDLDVDKLEAISVEALRLVQIVTPSPQERSVYDFRMHGVEQADINANGKIAVRASCSSLVEHCYQTQEVDLVNQEAVPEIASAEHLGEKVGRSGSVISRQLRSWMPPVAWPCRILFPSYQMKAFEKDLADLPYAPQLSDHPYVQPAAEPEPTTVAGTEEDADLE